MEEAGLGGRYRELEMGGWGATESMDAEARATFCRQPLPWDHIDSGVDKAWLAEDLERALAAVVVPDCSFDGCSHCGVCGPELGHNVVIPPPPVPPALPVRAPASERVSRLRFGFARSGSLARISHLDSVRLMERALRRSGLPVSFTGGFHPLPRLQFALSLPLGVEGLGEWFDLELTEPLERLDPEATRQATRREDSWMANGIIRMRLSACPPICLLLGFVPVCCPAIKSGWETAAHLAMAELFSCCRRGDRLWCCHRQRDQQVGPLA